MDRNVLDFDDLHLHRLFGKFDATPWDFPGRCKKQLLGLAKMVALCEKDGGMLGISLVPQGKKWGVSGVEKGWQHGNVFFVEGKFPTEEEVSSKMGHGSTGLQQNWDT